MKMAIHFFTREREREQTLQFLRKYKGSIYMRNGYFKACKLMQNLDSILGFPSKVYTNRLDSFSFISDSDHR